MGAFSNYLRNAILEYSLRGAALPAAPAQVYVALFTADPTPANLTANEVSAGTSPGYARVAMAAAAWNAAANGATANASAVTFPAATANWAAPVTYFGIYDASTGGNLLFSGALGASRTVLNGDQLRFGVGALTVTLS